MFVESLLESYAPRNARRRWATVTSFLLQALGIGLLVLLPFFYTEALPTLMSFRDVITPPSGGLPREPAPPVNQRPRTGASETVGATVLAPSTFRTHPMILTDLAPPTPECVGPCVVGSPITPGSNSSHVMDSILSTTMMGPPPPGPPSQERKRVMVSGGVMPGFLIRQIKPVYPPLAVQARIQGDVVLAAVISREGVIENLRVVSGHPMLIRSALDAVRQWRYRPYLLSGQPVEVETQIIVNFKLGG